MYAVTLSEGRVEWRERPDPVIRGEDLLVRVRAAGLNGADILQRAGRYPPPDGVPEDIPGLELAGEVIAVGPSVRRFEVGDPVMGIVAGGAQAEAAVIHERHAMPVPAGLAWESAGGLPEAFSAAFDSLHCQCHIAVGERLCVQGAAGGVGTAAVQLGRIMGCSVVAVVRDEKLHSAVRAYGCDVVAPADFVTAGPFDVVLELVGATNLQRDIASLAKGGRISVVGVSAGAKTEINLLALMNKDASIMGSTMRSRSLEHKAVLARLLEHHVLGHVSDGGLSVPIAATYQMADAAIAYERFAAGGKLGKIVLVNN